MAKKIIFLLIVIAVIIYAREKNIASKIPEMKNKLEMERKESSCTGFGGKFLKDFGECESVNENDCREMEGKFDECASACRHTQSETDSICTMECVTVCAWN